MRGKANIVVGVIVGLTLVAAVAVYAVMQMGAGGTTMRAVVHDGDGGVRELSLAEDQEQVVTTSLGTNVVVVEDGVVYVREADCDNQDCVHQGKVSAPGKQIICLPHKLWIEVVADGEMPAGEMDVNAVAGGDGKAENLDAVAR